MLVSPLGLADPRAAQASVALVLVGICVVVARRPVLFQLLGVIVAENGLSLLAIAVPGGLPYVIEIGACSTSRSSSSPPPPSPTASTWNWEPATPSSCGACVTELALLAPALALAGALAAALARTARAADRINVAAALVTATAGLTFAATALAHSGEAARHTPWLQIDAAGGVFVAVIATVGLCSALVSPSYLRTSGRSWFTAAGCGAHTTPRCTCSGRSCC